MVKRNFNNKLKGSNPEIIAFSYELRLQRSVCSKSRLLINKINAHGSGYVLELQFTKFSEITQCNGHYNVQGHSTSLILVSIEILYTTFY